MLASPTSVSFGVLSAAPANLAKTITLTNTGSASVTLAVAVAVDKKSFTGNSPSGTAPTVDKATLTIAAGATGTVTLTLNGTLPAAGSYSGAVTLQATGVSLRVPYLYLVGGPAYRSTGFARWQHRWHRRAAHLQRIYPRRPSGVAVKVIDQNGVPVANAPISWSATPRNSVTFQTPDSTTNSYGIAAAGIVPNQTGNLRSRFAQGRSRPALADRDAARLFDEAASVSCLPVADCTRLVRGDLRVGIERSGLHGLRVDPDLAPRDRRSDRQLRCAFGQVERSGTAGYVGPGQVNVQVPWELQGQTSAQVKVTIDESRSATW